MVALDSAWSAGGSLERREDRKTLVCWFEGYYTLYHIDDGNNGIITNFKDYLMKAEVLARVLLLL